MDEQELYSKFIKSLKEDDVQRVSSQWDDKDKINDEEMIMSW